MAVTAEIAATAKKAAEMTSTVKDGRDRGDGRDNDGSIEGHQRKKWRRLYENVNGTVCAKSNHNYYSFILFSC